MLLARSLVPDVSLKRGRDERASEMPYSGSLRLPTLGRSVRGGNALRHSVLGTRYTLGSSASSRSTIAANRLLAGWNRRLVPENVAAHSLSRYEHLDRAAGRSLLSVP
jgi:hypothetical protein